MVIHGELDPEAITEILLGRSCAALEIVINEANLIAGYHRADHVTMEHIMDACLRIVFKLKPGSSTAIDLNKDGSAAGTVYYETGHAVVSELLAPGSVSLVIAHYGNGSSMGVTRLKKDEHWSTRCRERKIIYGTHELPDCISKHE